MKLWGKVSVIEVIERILRTESPRCILVKDGGDTGSGLGKEFHSQVFSRLYEIQLNSTMVAVKLGFDYRDMTGEIHIRDDKIWKMAAQFPGIAESMGKLEPYYTHHRHGEFMKAMDRLFESEEQLEVRR